MMSDFKYTTAIHKIRSIEERIRIIQGGSSAGKTYAILPILIDMACRKKTSISVVSESFPHLRKGAMRDFINIMKMTNRYIDSHWNRTNSTYNFQNGSYIEFFSADSADKLRGSRRNVLFVNECNNITQEAYEQLAMRTSKDIYLDYNPSHSFWIDDVLKSDESKRIILTYKDNEALDKNIINYLESKRELAKTSDYWKNWVKVYLDGQQGSLEGVILNNWKEIDNIPSEAELLGYGLDFGFTNDPSTLIGVYKLDGELILDEVIYQTGLTNSQISKYIKSNDISEIIYADSAEPKSIRELKNYGHKILPAKKGKDSIIYGIQLLLEQPLRVTKRSINLKEELNRYMWKKDKNGNTLNVPIDNWNHCIDAIRYLVMSKLGNRNNNRKTFHI